MEKMCETTRTVGESEKREDLKKCADKLYKKRWEEAKKRSRRRRIEDKETRGRVLDQSTFFQSQLKPVSHSYTVSSPVVEVFVSDDTCNVISCITSCWGNY